MECWSNTGEVGGDSVPKRQQERKEEYLRKYGANSTEYLSTGAIDTRAITRYTKKSRKSGIN